MRTLAVAVVLALAASPLAAAESEARAGATFQALELKVLSAVQSNDAEALGSLLSPDFAWSIAFVGRPNDVMNREEWIAGNKHFSLKSFHVSGVVAEVFGKLALVNFRLTGSADLGKADVTGAYVVTDLWQQSGKDWKLLRRFVSHPAPLPVKR